MALFYGLGIGFIVAAVLVAIALYVFTSYAHMKALNLLGYDKAWLAWIPYGVYYACADCVSDNQENTMMFNKFSVPTLVFKLWWIVALVVTYLPWNSTITGIIRTALFIVFLGYTYAKMFARLEGKTEEETMAVGCVSGFLPIIAAIKFMLVK